MLLWQAEKRTDRAGERENILKQRSIHREIKKIDRDRQKIRKKDRKKQREQLSGEEKTNNNMERQKRDGHNYT